MGEVEARDVTGVAKVPADMVRGSDGRPRIGDLLVAYGIVSQTQLDAALRHQSNSGKRLGEVLVELGAVEERDLVTVLSEQMRIPLVDLRQTDVDPDAADLVPEAIARGTQSIPIKVEDGFLVVAMADPTSDECVARIEKASGLTASIRIAPASDIRRAIDNTYRALEGIDSFVQAFTHSERARRQESPSDEFVTEDSPVVEIVNLIITQACRDRASDVHIEPQAGQIRLRYRIDGALHDVLNLPEEMGPALTSRIKIMAGMNIVERRRPQDGQITTDVDDRELDIRVSTTATIWGEKTVLRLLDKSDTILRLSELGLQDRDDHTLLTRFQESIRSPFGMVVIAGPTGSGKTTTLYAALSEINRAERNIMTIEDPVEYIMPTINQLQINESADVTFAAGLKSILRQDPDVILVGEMRDQETARLAVQSALTGHFVLSSIHATDAPGALQRFVDMGIEPFMVASSMLAVASQRLLRRICPHCRERYVPSQDEMRFYEESGGIEKERGSFWRGKGCNFCARTGYHGRTAVFEFMPVSDEIKRLLIENASHDQLREAGIREGMRPMRHEAMRLVAEDETTIDEVIRAIYLL